MVAYTATLKRKVFFHLSPQNTKTYYIFCHTDPFSRVISEDAAYLIVELTSCIPSLATEPITESVVYCAFAGTSLRVDIYEQFGVCVCVCIFM